MINYLKKILYKNYINYKYKKIIKAHDNYKNIKNYQNNNEPINQLKKNGYIIIENFLEDISMHEDENWSIFNNSVKKIYPYIIKKNSVAHKIISNKKINGIISEYLGSNAVLDYVELQRIDLNSNYKSISEKWHYDDVGNRIKMFYFFNDSNDIYTDYIVSTNTIFHKKYSLSDSRINLKSKKNSEHEIKTIYPKKNNLFIFDTNGFHRGVYRNDINSEFKEAKPKFRKMLLFEYSNIQKSDALNSDILGPRKTFFSNEIDFDEILINKKYMINFKDFYFYDKFFVNSF